MACVEPDGGRLQIRDRKPSQEDPCPEIPPIFIDPKRMRKISGEIKGFGGPDEEQPPRSEAVSPPRAGQPEVLVRSVIATREDVHAFGRALREGWPIYCQWAQWVWSGQVELVLEALRVRQQELSLPEKDESEETPRCKVADALRYLENQKSRMHYAQYRRQGLPITSSHIESMIK